MGSTTEYKITLKKIWIHLKTICKHKFWVMYYCHKCGITWQGIIHDLSKFSFTEFWTNVKYVIPGKSPIDVQKEEIGFSMAWQHHKGHNPHHYEFWMDKFDDGCYVARMPFKYVVEMLCDNLAAGRAYQGKKFSYESEWNWWKKQRTIRNMHPDNAAFLQLAFFALYMAEVHPGDDIKVKFVDDESGEVTHEKVYAQGYEDKILNYETLHKFYDLAWDIMNPEQMKIKQPGEVKFMEFKQE